MATLMGWIDAAAKYMFPLVKSIELIAGINASKRKICETWNSVITTQFL
jgi:hypothetical protein